MTARSSLERMVVLRVHVAWHEAVAVAQEVAREAARAGIPVGLDNCVLSASGAIAIDGPSRKPFVGDAAFATLRAILDRDQAPRELLALVAQYESPQASAADFGKDLAFFARPDPGAAVAAVASRTLASEMEAQQQAEIERLRADAAAAQPSESKKPPKASRSPRPAVVAAAAAGVLLAIAAGLVISDGAAAPAMPAGNQTAPAPNLSAPATDITNRIGSFVEKGLATLGLAASDATASAAPAAPAPPPPVPRRTRSRRPPDVPRPTTLFVITPAPPVEPAPAHREAEMAETVLEPAPSELKPPVLRWPQLPNDPGTVPVDTNLPYLELLINERGTVDKVWLRARRSSLNDRMMVSAAKAWVFHPAEQDGRPVKYVMAVPIATP